MLFIGVCLSWIVIHYYFHKIEKGHFENGFEKSPKWVVYSMIPPFVFAFFLFIFMTVGIITKGIAELDEKITFLSIPIIEPVFWITYCYSLLFAIRAYNHWKEEEITSKVLGRIDALFVLSDHFDIWINIRERLFGIQKKGRQPTPD